MSPRSRPALAFLISLLLHVLMPPALSAISGWTPPVPVEEEEEGGDPTPINEDEPPQTTPLPALEAPSAPFQVTVLEEAPPPPVAPPPEAPRLAEPKPFFLLDPADLADPPRKAASIKGASASARTVDLDELHGAVRGRDETVRPAADADPARVGPDPLEVGLHGDDLTARLGDGHPEALRTGAVDGDLVGRAAQLEVDRAPDVVLHLGAAAPGRLEQSGALDGLGLLVGLDAGDDQGHAPPPAPRPRGRTGDHAQSQQDRKILRQEGEPQAEPRKQVHRGRIAVGGAREEHDRTE